MLTITDTHLYSTIAAALGILLGAYFGIDYQKQVSADLITNKDAIIAELQTELAQRAIVTKEPASFPVSVPSTGSLSSLLDIASNVPIPTPVKSPLSITLPHKGQHFCRNTTFAFSWQGDPAKIDQVRVWIDTSKFPTSPLYDGPLAYNETGAPDAGSIDWRVGTAPMGISWHNIPDDELYRIKYDVLHRGVIIYSGTSDFFVIQTCEG